MLPWRKTRNTQLALSAEYGPVRDVMVMPRASTTTLAKPDPWLIEALLGRASSAGINVTPLTAMGVPTVYACVNAISRSMSSISLKLYRRMPDGAREEASDHPLYSLLHDSPNDEMTSASFRRALYANAALRNVGYAEIIRNGLGEVAEIYPLKNQDIHPHRDVANGPLYYLVKGQRVAKEDIINILGLTFDGILGADASSLARDAIGLAIALQDHAARYFPNAASPSLVATSPATNLSPQQIEQIRNEIISRTSGSNAHSPMVLLNGAQVKSIEVSDNQKGQFIEARKAQDMSICQIFGVPPIKAGITTDAHYNNVWSENESYITDCLVPWAIQSEQMFNKRILSPRQQALYYFEYNFDSLLRGDPAQRAALYEKLIQMGVMTRNEVRRKENLNPVIGGDNFMVSQNLQLLDKDGKPVPKPVEAKPALTT